MSQQKKQETRLNRVEVQLNSKEKALAVALSERMGTPVATILRIALNRWAQEEDVKVPEGKRAAGGLR